MLRCLLILPYIAILWFTSYRSFAQDIIKKNNGEELITKVVEVGDTVIKYKKFEDPEFYTYTLPKKEVKTIKYENGKTINPNKRSKESYLELRSAISLPIGNYGSSNSDGTNPGFAQPGFGTCLEFGFKISRKFGLSVDLGSFYNEYDKKSIDDELRRNLGSGEKITTSYTRYNGNYLLFGFQHYIKFGKKITWVNKISAGFMSYSKPEFNYIYSDSLSPSATISGPVYYKYSSSAGHGSNGVFGFKTSLWFKLSNRFTLTGNVEVLSSQQKVYFNIKSSGNTGGTSGGSANMSPDGNYAKVIPVNILNAGLGMIFYLRKKR